ncbi:cytoplasmic polyadenylation element-binding protein isoform X2 [Cryptotermes secundus]|uniref:cytoplasmic polyadenylation element-binding protein isoform X2 n=1 Tax=Cryptotermes secundus TaxID=105785 RepID=UPI000CD7DCCC|nr:cytoplasmic polyadenylation element-binding protein isoform X2 [Cryptotermes secundus]
MGCGQSKIGIIYPRKSKSKSGNKRSGVDPDSDEETDEADPGLGDAGDAEEAGDGSKVRQMVAPSPGPLLAQTEISSSQMDFFKMLDEKIENGPDYDSANEEEIAVERARLCALLRDWETASTNSSLNRSAPSTPAHRKLPSKPQGPPPSPYYHPQLNGELFLQQQNQQLQLQQQQQHQQLQQQYFQHQLQYQQNMRGQFMVSCSPQITRVAPVLRNYQPMSPVPMQQHASSVVQYRQSRGSYTELA